VTRCDVDPERVALWLANFSCTQFSQLFGVVADATGDETHQCTPFFGREVPPHVVVRTSRIRNGATDGVIVRSDDASEWSGIFRLEDFEGFEAVNSFEAATNEGSPRWSAFQKCVGKTRIDV
jgi:hypothetical protein